MTGRILTVYAVYLLAAMSPGPAVFYVMRTSVGSRGHGVRAALGVATGTTLWICIAALGLSTVFRDNPRLMSGILVAGGIYFLRLCWVLARSAATPGDRLQKAFAPASKRAAYLQGLATNLTNPGTALFFTGLLGLYDVPRLPSSAQLAVYGGIPVLSIGWYGGLSLAFSNQRMSRAYLKLRRPFDGTLAALFLYLGIKLILSLRG